MNARLRRWALWFGIGFGLGGPTLFASRAALAAPPKHTPTAQDRAAAHELMRKGIEEYRKNRMEAAREAFLEAWTAYPHAAIAANLAEVEERLARYRDAAEHWRAYLDLLPAERAQEHAEAERALDRCHSELASLKVTTDHDGSAIVVDGRPAGQSPLKLEIWLEPGTHNVTVRNGSEAASSPPLALKAGERRTIELSVGTAEPAPPPKKTSVPVVAPVRVPRRQRGIPPKWIVLGGGAALTGAALGVGIVYVMEANQAYAEGQRLIDELDRMPAAGSHETQCSSASASETCRGLQGKIDELRRDQLIARVAFVGAGVTALATTALFVWWPGQHANDGVASMRFRPWLGGKRVGAELALDF